MKKLFILAFLLPLGLGCAVWAQEEEQELDEIELTASLDNSYNQVVGFNFSGTPGEKFIIHWGEDCDTVLAENTDEIEMSYVVEGIPISTQLNIRIVAMHPTGHILSISIDSVYKYLFIAFKSPEITTIRCSHNELEALYFYYCSSVKILDCSYNRLLSLSLGSLINSEEKADSLTHLNCSHNYILNLSDLSDCKALVSLHCENNRIEYLRANTIPTLKEVYCQNNQIHTCILDANPALERVNCSNNNLFDLLIDSPSLDSLDFSNNNTLHYLHISNSKLKSLDLSVAPNLETLWCNGNDSLTMLKVDNPILRGLECTHNQLESLLIDNCPILDALLCNYNRLTSVLLPSDIVLESLACDSNSLTLSNVADLVKQVSISAGTSPQLIAVLRQVGQMLDLRSEMNINDKKTQWNILDVDGNIITDNADWGVYNYGNFSFKKTGKYRIALKHYALPDHNGELRQAEVFYDVTIVDSVARPVFSEPSGAVKSHTPVSLSTSTPDARIYYTVDGSVPDSTALLYTAPISIDEEITIKAISILDTLTSRVAMASYRITDTTTDNEYNGLAHLNIYAKDKMIYIPESIGKVEVFTANGQCVYRGSATAIPVKRSGLYVVVAKGGRWKVAVR